MKNRRNGKKSLFQALLITAVLVLTLPGECGAAAAHAGKEDRVVYGDERADVYLPLLEGKPFFQISQASWGTG